MAANDTLTDASTPLGTPEVEAEFDEADLFGPLLERPQEPCAFVIFGASGDLTSRKLIPALYNLSARTCCQPGSR